ncbi:MAG: META domain-containing protein [Treponema sp.]|nr:META domain-containing protein [Treponema sp.]
MKNRLIITLITICLMCFIAGNISARAIDEKDTQKASASNKNFSNNLGKQWFLTNVKVNGADTGFSREELAVFNSEEIFSIKFEAGLLSGVAAPNRYSGPYTVGENQSIKIPPMRSTLMASIFESKNLKENDYYVYLQSAYKWNRKDQSLEIYSKTGNDEVVMSFVCKE